MVRCVSGSWFAHRRVLAVLTTLLSAAAVGVAPGADARSDAPAIENNYSVAATVPFSIAAADGTILAGTVYVPNVPAGTKVGTVLNLSPYWGTGAEPTDDVRYGDRLRGRWDWFTQAGFAFAAVNLRGTGDSGGCMQWGGKLDQSDAYAIVQALSAQPWSNGRVGMFGFSFDGWSPYMAVAAHPPALKAIVPVSGIIDLWSLLTRNGAPIIVGPAVSAIWIGQTTSGVNNRASGREARWSPDQVACPRFGPEQAEQLSTVWNGDRSPYWEERSYREEIAKSDVAVFAVNGLRPARFNGINPLSPTQLPYAGEGHILQFEGLWDLLEPGRRQLLVGQWDHGYPGLPEEGYNPAKGEAFFRPLVIDWFDRYLNYEDPRSRDNTVLYQDTTFTWRKSGAWPPADRDVSLPLTGAAIAGPRTAVPAESEQSFQSGVHQFGRDPGPTACGTEQVAYTSPPLAHDVHLAGNFTAQLRLTSTLPDGNLAAFLYADSDDDICNASPVRELGRALTDLRHWEYDGYGSDFPVLLPTTVPLLSQPFAVTARQGERLVLVIGGDATELLPDPRKPFLTVASGGSEGSSLRLPVVGGNLKFMEDR